MTKIIRTVIILILLSSLFFVVRLQNLTTLPVFGDEAIYIRWSQIIKNEETLRFVPLTDGKQPLFMWASALSLKFFSDPLFASRFVSVLSGWGCLILLFFVSPQIYYYHHKTSSPLKFIYLCLTQNPALSIITSLVYIFLPFSFFFDRLATADALLSFFGLLSLSLAILLSKFPRLDLAMILGFSLGFAWLTKSPAIYFIALSFLTFFILNFRNLKQFYFPFVSLIIAFGMYNILRLGPQFQQIALRNQDYVWSFSEILKHPFDPLNPHISDIITLYSQYVSLPVISISILGLVFLFIINRSLIFKTLNLRYLVLFCWWILPLVANAAIAKVFTARYILFVLPSFIILLSLGFYFLITKSTLFFKNYITPTLLIIISFSFNIFWIYRISFTPNQVTLPSTESGYVSGWTSGWGINEISNYFIERSKVANVIVGTEGNFGTLPDGVQIYTDHRRQITVFGVGLGFTEIPDKMIDAKKHGDEVYLVINRSRLSLSSSAMDKVSIIQKYAKPFGDELLLIKI